MKRLILLMLLILSVLQLSAQSRRVAVINMDNVNGDPQYDYLEGIIRGILLFDLSSQNELDLVVRSELDAVIAEQKLALSGLVDNEAIKVGELLSADYLISGEYIFLGQEVMINLSLIDVSTGRTTAYRNRGDKENVIHGLSEEILRDILGQDIVLQGEGGERSILSFKDVSPGSLSIFTPLVDAEIYLDGNFIGYTTGDAREPYIIEDIPPGSHILGIRLQGFGTVELPQYDFVPYDEEVIIESGKKLTIRPQVWHFNDWIYRGMSLFDKDWTYSRSPRDAVTEIEEELEFQDLEGRVIKLRLLGEFFNGEEDKRLALTLFYNGEPLEIKLIGDGDDPVEIEESIGIVEVDCQFTYSRLNIDISRNDIWQGMQYE